MAEHNPLESVVAQLLQALHTQTVTLSDTSRLVSGICDSLKVALDKLDKLEDRATRLDEKASRMDATHFTNMDDVARQVAEIRVEIVEIKELFFSIESTLQSLPSDSDIAKRVADRLKETLATLPTLREIRKALESVMVLVCAGCEEKRNKKAGMMSSFFDRLFGFCTLLSKNKMLTLTLLTFLVIILLLVCRFVGVDPIGFIESLWGSR